LKIIVISHNYDHLIHSFDQMTYFYEGYIHIDLY